MNDADTESLESLDRLLSELRTGSAPVDGLVATGRARKRRRRGAGILGVGAATVLVLAGVAVAGRAPTTSDQPLPAAQRGEADQPSSPEVTESGERGDGPSRTSSPRERWLDRDRLLSCGTFPLHSVRDPAPNPYGTCLRAARTRGEGAEAVVTVTGMEPGGDSVVYIRVEPSGKVETFSDATGDNARPGWRYATCDNLASAVALSC